MEPWPDLSKGHKARPVVHLISALGQFQHWENHEFCGLPNEAGKRWKASDSVKPNITSYLAKVLVCWPFWLRLARGWSGMTTPSTIGPKGVVYIGTFSCKARLKLWPSFRKDLRTLTVRRSDKEASRKHRAMVTSVTAPAEVRLDSDAVQLMPRNTWHGKAILSWDGITDIDHMLTCMVMSLGSSLTAMGDRELPLINMAFWNNSLWEALATGDVIKKDTKAAPVPWPIKVTDSGLPPKAPTFSLSQCKAAIWSKRPKLETTSRCSPGLRNPLIRKKGSLLTSSPWLQIKRGHNFFKPKVCLQRSLSRLLTNVTRRAARLQKTCNICLLQRLTHSQKTELFCIHMINGGTLERSQNAAAVQASNKLRPQK